MYKDTNFQMRHASVASTHAKMKLQSEISIDNFI